MELTFFFNSTPENLVETLFPTQLTENSFMAEFAVFTSARESFQHFQVSMEFPSVDFNWFVRPQSDLVS